MVDFNKLGTKKQQSRVIEPLGRCRLHASCVEHSLRTGSCGDMVVPRFGRVTATRFPADSARRLARHGPEF